MSLPWLKGTLLKLLLWYLCFQAPRMNANWKGLCVWPLLSDLGLEGVKMKESRRKEGSLGTLSHLYANHLTCRLFLWNSIRLPRVNNFLFHQYTFCSWFLFVKWRELWYFVSYKRKVMGQTTRLSLRPRQFWTTMLWISAGCSLGNLKGTNHDRNSWGTKIHNELYSYWFIIIQAYIILI